MGDETTSETSVVGGEVVCESEYFTGSIQRYQNCPKITVYMDNKHPQPHPMVWKGPDYGLRLSAQSQLMSKHLALFFSKVQAQVWSTPSTKSLTVTNVCS